MEFPKELHTGYPENYTLESLKKLLHIEDTFPSTKCHLCGKGVNLSRWKGKVPWRWRDGSTMKKAENLTIPLKGPYVTPMGSKART